MSNYFFSKVFRTIRSSGGGVLLSTYCLYNSYPISCEKISSISPPVVTSAAAGTGTASSSSSLTTNNEKTEYEIWLEEKQKCSLCRMFLASPCRQQVDYHELQYLNILMFIVY